MPRQPELIEPEWPAPPGVRALVTTRAIGDVKAAQVREKLSAALPAGPVWLTQVHGTVAVDAAQVEPNTAPEADASFATRPNIVCTVMAADCMPVLLAARDGAVVAAAHAGWRGLCGGIIERTVGQMGVRGESLIAYLGPAIGPRAYEVGDEVRNAFVARDPGAAAAFAAGRPGHWLLDLYAIARQRLSSVGVDAVYGGGACTYSEPERFFSFRRDKAMQRMAACIWRV